jgi:hypothetical protein
MGLENERLMQLAKVIVEARRHHIALNRACAHKSANSLEKPTPEELTELRAAMAASHAAHDALLDHVQNGHVQSGHVQSAPTAVEATADFSITSTTSLVHAA